MTLPSFLDSLPEIIRAQAAPGAALALSLDGERYTECAGLACCVDGTPLKPASRFQLGCITKLLTAVVTLEMANAGKLDLDAAISRYIPHLSNVPAVRSITARHLLSHTGGYQGVNVADPAIRYCFTWSKLVELLQDGHVLFSPGSVFNYEHTECVLLGEVLQQISGTSIHDLYRGMIFAPLNISCGNTKSDGDAPGLIVHDHVRSTSGGGYVGLRSTPHCSFWDASLSDLTMTLPDIVTIGEAVAGFGKSSVFSARTIEMLRTPYVSLPRTFGGRLQEKVPVAFSCGCAQYGTNVFGHNGSARGQTVALRFDLRSRLVVAVGLSCWQPYLRDLICAKVIASVTDSPVGEVVGSHNRSWRTTDVIGRYVGARGSYVEVTQNAQDLICTVSAAVTQSHIRLLLHPLGSGDFEVHTDASHLTVGFFTAPDGGMQPSMMVALNAYRREDT